MDKHEIISKLPYSQPFLFVDDILEITEDGVKGTFTFDENLDFFKGHFRSRPVVPGVILTEVMAQIGVVCLGIYLLDNEFSWDTAIALTSTQVDFYKAVFPTDKVIVISTKKYFRFGKLKCDVKMIDEDGGEICSGVISGMIVK